MNHFLKYYDAVKKIKTLQPKLYKEIKRIESLKREKYNNMVLFIDHKNKIKYKLIANDFSATLLRLNTCPISHDDILRVTNYEIILTSKFKKGSITKHYNFQDNNYYFELTSELYMIFDMFKVEPTTFDLSTPVESGLLHLSLNHDIYEIYDILSDNPSLKENISEESIFYIKLLLD